MQWNWQELLFGIITTVLGWLAGVLRPPPGTQRKPRFDEVTRATHHVR